MSNSVTLWTVACQAPLSIGFSREEYWSGLPFLSPGDRPDPGIKHEFRKCQADSLPSEPPGEKYAVDSIKKEEKSDICSNMDKLQRHHAK